MSAAVGPRPAPATGSSKAPGRTRELVRGRIAAIPRAGWLCALVMLANAVAWSLLTPPFEVPDENAHYAYVQQVAERGTLPRPVGTPGHLSPAQDSMLAATLFYQIVGETTNPAPFSELQQHRIAEAEHSGLSSRGSGDALSATSNPPLYYALAAIPYKLASGGSVLTRLTAMRLMSSLMAAVTVLLIFLFLSELLPGTPWAWTVGALVAAFQPLFSFMSGGLNNDNLLYLAAAGLLWSLARAFRRGLTPAGGVAVGAFLAIGLVTKFTMIGLIPAAALGLALMVWRAPDERRRAALKGAAAGVAVAAAPALLYVVLNRYVWDRTAIPGGVGAVAALPGSGKHFSTAEEISHIWQLYLPSIGMKDQFSYYPLWKTWFKGFYGRLGWLDYKLPYHGYLIAFVISLGVAALALVELVRRRLALRMRLAELLVYLVALAGLCVEIGVQSYREWIQTNGFGQFEQARYLLPMLALYAAIAALAARAGGRRWGPIIGAALVMLAIGHDLAAQVITIGRFYT